MSARSLNKVMLIGNLTKDPVLRYTPSGTPVATFGLATNREYTAADGNKVEEAEYHNVTVWSKLAEICDKIIRKGMKVYVEGRLRTYSYADKESGKNIYRTEIVATDMFIIGFPKSMQGGANSDDNSSDPAKKDVSFDDAADFDFNDLSDTPLGSTAKSDDDDDDTKTPF